jgi:hypothetical protein
VSSRVWRTRWRRPSSPAGPARAGRGP